MSDSDETGSHADKATTVVVGGDVHRFRITLAFHGDALEPSEISEALRCHPTHAHRAGDPRTGRSARFGPWRKGAWLLSMDGAAPAKIRTEIGRLLDQLPEDEQVWASLTGRFRAELGLGIFLDSWNRGFDLPATLLARIASLGLSVDFDIYADAADEDNDDTSQVSDDTSGDA